MAAIPAKSILKSPSQQPTASDPPDEQQGRAATRRRHLEIALQHAHRIQYQKDVQSQVLKNIETLLDLPSEDPATAPDIHLFLSLAHLFQPSDFDELAEERRVDGKCGYALCSSAPRSASIAVNQAWKLKKGQGDWCTNECAKKALHVKAQLSEVLAWERAPGQQAALMLHEDDRHLLRDEANRSNASRRGGNRVQQRVANAEDLAAERGERATSSRPKQVMSEMVVEKPTVVRPLADAARAMVGSATAIEGYEPAKARSKAALPTSELEGSDDEDQEDQVVDEDWEEGNSQAAVAGVRKPDHRSHVVGAEESESWNSLFENIDSTEQRPALDHSKRFIQL